VACPIAQETLEQIGACADQPFAPESTVDFPVPLASRLEVE
jgi:hypothetical protein